MAVVKTKHSVTHFIKLKVDGRWTRFPGVKDRTTSKLIERRIAKLVYAKTHHEPVPADVLEWLRDLPARSPRLFDRLVDAGLADSVKTRRRKLIDLLLGEIMPKAGFEEQARHYHRNAIRRRQ